MTFHINLLAKTAKKTYLHEFQALELLKMRDCGLLKSSPCNKFRRPIQRAHACGFYRLRIILAVLKISSDLIYMALGNLTLRSLMSRPGFEF